MLQSAYCIYSAGLLFSDVFRQKDVGPSTAAASLAALTALLVGLGMSRIKTEGANAFITRYGFAFAAAPLFAASPAGRFYHRRTGRGRA